LPDVIILDLMMPEMDGFQLVAALQQHPRWRRIPVVVVTALDLSAEDSLDVMMPDIDGWTVLAALRGDPQLADIPVVMATIVDERRQGMTLGAVGYLTKPIDRDKLVEIMRRYGAPSGPTQVLVVEDDATQRDRVRSWLGPPQWLVTEAENGRAALCAQIGVLAGFVRLGQQADGLGNLGMHVADHRNQLLALSHHIGIDLLEDAFYELKVDAAPGVDRLTWKDYEADLKWRRGYVSFRRLLLGASLAGI
jgi:CheY-like chemotaxis protein